MRSSRFAAHRRQIQLEQRAFGHRAHPTASELRLWEALRAGKLGVQFRRQVPVCGRYIADFCAPAMKLVIEVDGGSHASRRSADARRDRVLAAHGYRTLRLPASLVTASLEQALELVRQVLRA
jgi:very-short-patch-repair endonuclease